jgi:hypothetical protein
VLLELAKQTLHTRDRSRGCLDLRRTASHHRSRAFANGVGTDGRRRSTATRQLPRCDICGACTGGFPPLRGHSMQARLGL